MPAPFWSGTAAPGELDVLDGGVVAADDPNPFTAVVLAGGVDLRPSVHAPQGEPVFGDSADIAVVAAGGVDLDRVAVARGGDGSARLCVHLARPDRQRGRAGGQRCRKCDQHRRAEKRGPSTRMIFSP